MSNADKIRMKMKELLKFSATSEKKFTDVPTKDGKTLVSEDKELQVGSILSMIDADGNTTVCEDGTYELTDGRTVVIKGGTGAIESIADAAKPEDAKDDSPVEDAALAAEPVVEEVPAVDAEEAKVDGKLEDRVAELESQLAQLLELVQGLQNSQTETMSAVTKLSADDVTAVPAMVALSKAKAKTNDAREEYKYLMSKNTKEKVIKNKK